MEIILKKDVQNLGFKDDVVTVKNGYGRNYLIPQGFAVLATSSAKKVLAENLRQKAHKEAKLVADAKSLAEAIKALEIKITAKAGGDKLFGSVSSADIAAALESNGHSIEKKFITSGLIKRVGKYTASVRLHREVIVELPYEVVGEKA
ncbi:MAG: 50S ribosomal protein L9 [Flavobacterium haoranii]|nr:50S ribosomal protein L9 [Flavobacteriaceae bacterium]